MTFLGMSQPPSNPRQFESRSTVRVRDEDTNADGAQVRHADRRRHPQDVRPSGYDDVLMPVHAVSLVAMGLWLLDNCDLEACATTAAELQQWDFHLAVAPIRFAGASGSPVNPIATF
jgi:hypothetical protein